jgi:hypothetical protein
MTLSGSYGRLDYTRKEPGNMGSMRGREKGAIRKDRSDCAGHPEQPTQLRLISPSRMDMTATQNRIHF